MCSPWGLKELDETVTFTFTCLVSGELGNVRMY